MNSKETRRNQSTFETTMRAALQWFGFAAFLFSASLLFLKMGFYELSVSSTCSRDVSSSYKVVEMEVTCNTCLCFVSGDFFADAKSMRRRQKSLSYLANVETQGGATCVKRNV